MKRSDLGEETGKASSFEKKGSIFVVKLKLYHKVLTFNVKDDTFDVLRDG